jgi:hypothetical protein
VPGRHGRLARCCRSWRAGRSQRPWDFRSAARRRAHADQVLAGVTAGDQQLQIGFEDMPRATGDNDFQDVVIAIRITADDNRIM